MSFADLLERAVAAARDAGAMLLEEFTRAGGPRGHDGHAEIDEPVERMIREAVMAVLPDAGFVGEETDHERTDAEYVWIVDPNDGTDAFLSGWRGSSVSIALARHGTPVLGVVFAFAARNGNGDLFAWADECGPVTRNGAPVDRVWAKQLTDESIVAVSDKADTDPRTNADAMAPARYLPVPGIAYRMALAATGAVEMAASMNAVQSWDIAAGLALIRGAGGVVVDGDGTPIEHVDAGRHVFHRIFVGSPHLAPALAARCSGVTFRRRPADDPTGLCFPRRGEAIADPALLDRVTGCWLGQLAGDALGSMVEFGFPETIRREHNGSLRTIGGSPLWHTIAGQPTDDSEMALALARTLLAEGSPTDEELAEAYLAWKLSRPFDVGNTIRQAVTAMQEAPEGRRAAEARRQANRRSEANGALMRLSPIAIWGHALSAEEVDEMARRDAALTHPNRVCADSSAAFAVALAATIRDGLDGNGAYAVAVEWNRAHGTSDSVTGALEAARDREPRFGHNSGHVIVALQNAFYQALHAANVEEGIVATVMGGGDTDTNAAIAGALLGAIHGESSIPEQWRRSVLTCRPLAGLPGVQEPRPMTYWPCDAPILAERLAVRGRERR